MTTFTYPITIKNGTVNLINDQDYVLLIPQVIRHIVQTTYEERVLNVSFGIPDYLFTTSNDIVPIIRTIEHSLKVNMSEYPGVTMRVTGAMLEDGLLALTIYYKVDELNDKITITLA
jgi:hypothetical protein